MAFGTLGSTLNDELNRLANGGTYRDSSAMVDEALAAKQWANRENIVPYSTDTVGILNEIAALGPNRQNWYDFNGVCNYLAGTTGLPAAAALRQITTTGDILTSLAAFYTDAATPRYNYPGYITLNGTSQYISTPDENALDITTDIDVRVRVAMDDWTPSGQQSVISKWNNSSNSWDFNVTNTFGPFNAGALQFVWVDSGGTSRSAGTNTTVVPFTDGQVGWIRVTLDVDNGASGNDAKFFTSTDGTTWTQLGSTVTQAFTTSIRSGTAEPRIGVRDGDRYVAGKVYQAQVFASINGTDKRFDADLTTNVTSATYDQFTATTGQLCTINGQNTLTNGGSAGSLLPVTVGSSLAADSNDAKFLDHTGTNYVYLPGVESNIITVPNSAAFTVTDLDVRVQVALDDWTPAAQCSFMSRYVGAGERSWTLRVLPTTGILRLQWSTDGTAVLFADSTVAPTVADGATLWVRATLDVDNGASGKDVKFFTSTNGTTWTQLGGTVTTAGTTNIFNINNVLSIGGEGLTGQGNALFGKVFKAQLMNGIDGTKVLDVDTSVITSGAATSFTATTGQTVTINRSTSGRKTVAVTQPTWLFGTDDYMEVNNRYMAHSGSNYLYLPGVASNYASAPDAAVLDITGDIDIRVKVAMDDWTPATQSGLLAKSDVAADAYLFYIVAGVLQFFWVNAAGASTTVSSAGITIPDGTTKWVRVTLDVDNGAGGNTATFFTSDDGITWTALGSPVVNAGVTNIRATTAQLNIGTQRAASNFSRGKFFRAQVLNGIGGTVAFDANFEGSITSLNQASFTESSSNAATVTINRSGSAYRSAGITAAGYLYPGATNTFANSTTDFLNFGATDSFTLVAVHRNWATTSTGRIIDKRAGLDGYQLYTVNNTQMSYFYGDSTNFVADGGRATYTQPNLSTTVLSINRSTQQATLSVNAGTGTVASIAAVTGSPSNVLNLNIGRYGEAVANYSDMELIGVAVFRSVLTAAQIRQITNYFANREAYL